MVEDRITDGKRIAQLLASELTGLQEGPLEDVGVVDADPDAMPTATGTEAYRVQYRGEVIATVFLYPEYATVRFETDQTDLPEPVEDRDLQVDGDTDLQVTSGAAVKRAVDVIRVVLDDAVN